MWPKQSPPHGQPREARGDSDPAATTWNALLRDRGGGEGRQEQPPCTPGRQRGAWGLGGQGMQAEGEGGDVAVAEEAEEAWEREVERSGEGVAGEG